MDMPSYMRKSLQLVSLDIPYAPPGWIWLAGVLLTWGAKKSRSTRTACCDANHRPLATALRTLTSSTLFFEEILMAYVITDTCIKDALCVDVCPVDCIHPKKDEPAFEAATQMYVNPAECIDCGACVPVCTSDSIHTADDVPEDKKEFIEKNAAYFN
jgi:NAD-dependent dihydropyrimidine dehydrogenase PreA subunit